MKLSKLSTSQKKLLQIRLGWWLLEQKLLYYNPEYGKCVHDEEYDRNEDTYKLLCTEFGLEPTASNNVGFPWDSPSGRMIATKFKNGNKDLTSLNVSNAKQKPVEPVRTRTRQRTRPKLELVPPVEEYTLHLVEEEPRKRTRSRPKEDEERVRRRPRKRSP